MGSLYLGSYCLSKITGLSLKLRLLFWEELFGTKFGGVRGKRRSEEVPERRGDRIHSLRVFRRKQTIEVMLAHDLLSRGDDDHHVTSLSLNQIVQKWVRLTIVLENVSPLRYLLINLKQHLFQLTLFSNKP